MSDAQPQPMPAAMHAPAAPPRAGSAVGGFFVDLAIAVVVMLAVSFVAFAGWGVLRAVQVAMQGEVDPGDAEALMQAIGHPGGLAMIWVTLLGTGTAALVPYLFRRRATASERAASRIAARRGATWGWIAVTAVVVFALSALATTLARQFGVEPEPTNQEPIKQAMAASPWFVCLFVVLIAPMYEELLFRRVLFGRLWAAGKPLLGMWLSGIAFALMHEPPGMTGNPWPSATLLWAVYAFMGIAFAWVYRRTGTLWAPIAAHALNNALALLVLGSA